MEREPPDSAAMGYNPSHRCKVQKLSFHCYGKHSRRGVDNLASLGRKLFRDPHRPLPALPLCQSLQHSSPNLVSWH